LLWIPDQASGLSGMTLENVISSRPSKRVPRKLPIIRDLRYYGAKAATALVSFAALISNEGKN